MISCKSGFIMGQVLHLESEEDGGVKLAFAVSCYKEYINSFVLLIA